MKYLFDSPVATCTFSKVDDCEYFFLFDDYEKGKKETNIQFVYEKYIFFPMYNVISGS